MKRSILVLVLSLFAAGNIWAQAVPLPLVAVGKGDYTICVDKSEQKLYVFNGRSGVLTLNCSTGQNPGDKQSTGDKRTPEGVYFPLQIIDGTTLPPIYGWRAYVLDYPNPIDNYAGKNGHGIWIHGRNKPLDSTDTKGCVSLNNDDLKKIAPFLNPYMTPVVTLGKLNYVAVDDQMRRGRQCLDALNNWLDAWQTKDLERLRACYAPEFVELGTGRRLEAYMKYKQGLFNRYETIRLRTTAPKIVAGERYFIASFLLEFSGGNYRSLGVKYVYLDRQDYRIMCERFVDLNTAPVWNEMTAKLEDRPMAVAKLTPPVKPAVKPKTELLSDRSLASIKAEVMSDAPTGRSNARPVAAAPKLEAAKLETVAYKPAETKPVEAKPVETKAEQAPETDNLPPDVLAFLDQWRKAWEAKDLETMRSYYTADFPGLEAFFARKQRNLAPYATIRVAFEDLNVVQNGDYYEIRARQHFMADAYQDFGIKQIRLVKQNGTYLIMDESWRRVEDHT